MFKDKISVLFKNKNTILFITTVFYIFGLFAFFQNHPVTLSFIVTAILSFLLITNYISKKQALVWLLAFYFAFFNASFQTSNFSQLSSITPQNVVAKGRILSIPNNSYENKSKFFFEINELEYENNRLKNLKEKTFVALTSLDNNFPELKIGNAYEIKGLLKSPFKAGNPSQFDYSKYLKNFHVHTLFYADAKNCTNLNLPLNHKQKFLQSLNNIRTDIITAHSNYLKSPNLEIVGGIVFGDDAVAPPDYVKTSFINSGLLHILAASGMNVAFIFGFWAFLLSRLKTPYNIKILTGIVLIILYSLMTGLGPSVIRATFMLVIVLLGKLIDRDTDTIALLAFVALIMLVYNPAFINNVGFQLSFIVTFGLLLTSPVIFEHTKKIPSIISGAIFIPIIAQIWVAPIQMFYFNTISTYSVFANILTVPLLSVISFGGFISSILAVIKPIANNICMVFDFILNPVVSILLSISNYFGSLPNSLVITTHPSLFQITLYYLLIISLIFFFKNTEFKKLYLTSFCSVLLILLITIIPIKNNNTEIIVFDVQNADSFLIKTPNNKYIAIDTGKSGYLSFSQANSIMLKYMKDNGIKSLDTLIITHYDNDHAGGTVDFLKQLKINNLIVNSLKSNSFTSDAIFEELKLHKNTNLSLVKNNNTIYSENNFNLTTFNAGFKEEKYENENSIITLLNSYGFKMLFMGDAGIAAYHKLQNDLAFDIDILKVGHHGADNVVTTSMLNKLNPEVSIISVGNNKFGHPNNTTLNLLSNTKILRTDEVNSIKIIIPKNKPYKILHYDTKKKKYVKI